MKTEKEMEQYWCRALNTLDTSTTWKKSGSWEFVRDFCGSYYDEAIANLEDSQYIYWAPEAIKVVASHFNIDAGENLGKQERIDHLKMVVLKCIEYEISTAPVAGRVENIGEIERVILNAFYNNIYGDRIRAAAKSLIMGDSWKALKYINAKVEDPEMAKILSKAINGYKTDNINFNVLFS